MIALTGATGHLGQSLLRQLRSRGDGVVAVVRPESDRSLLEGYCDDIREASLNDAQSLARAFDGAVQVIHAAGLIDIRRGQIDRLRQVNVQGTAKVMEACKTAGIQRLAYISSIEAFNLSLRRRPVREDFGFARGNAVMDYGETKAEASRLVVAAGLEGSLDTVLLCPTAIIGPWDYRGGQLTRVIRSYLKRKLPALMGGGMDFVDVRDVAGAVLAALEKGRSGETYLVAGEYAEIPEFFSCLERVSGIGRPHFECPPWLGKTAGEFSEVWSRLTNTHALFSRGAVDILQEDVRVDAAKAMEELGYRPRRLEDSLSDVVAWMRDDAEVNPDPLFF